MPGPIGPVTTTSFQVPPNADDVGSPNDVMSGLTCGRTSIPSRWYAGYSRNEEMNPWWRSYQRCPSVGTSMPASSWSPIIERTPSVKDSANSASRIATRKSRSRTSNRFHVGLGYEPTCVVGNRCPTMSLRFRATPPLLSRWSVDP